MVGRKKNPGQTPERTKGVLSRFDFLYFVRTKLVILCYGLPILYFVLAILLWTLQKILSVRNTVTVNTTSCGTDLLWHNGFFWHQVFGLFVIAKRVFGLRNLGIIFSGLAK